MFRPTQVITIFFNHGTMSYEALDINVPAPLAAAMNKFLMIFTCYYEATAYANELNSHLNNNIIDEQMHDSTCPF